MTVLVQEPWTWILYPDDDRRILSVFTGGVATWELAVELTPDEIAAWNGQGIAGLQHLVSGIQRTPAAYGDRRVAV